MVSGPQADVADDQWGLLYEERRRGILERYPLEKAKKLLKADGWNEFVITAKGSHVTIDLNGTRIIDRDDPKFDKEGIIALQIHVWKEPMEVRFKDIEIKELDPCDRGRSRLRDDASMSRWGSVVSVQSGLANSWTCAVMTAGAARLLDT